MRKEFQVNRKVAECRLDIALCQLIPDLSRRKIRTIVDQGGAYLNSKRVRISSRLVKYGDKIVVEYDANSLVKKDASKKFILKANDILYEDDYCIIINKPPGLPSQATRQQSVCHIIPFIEDYYKTLDSSKKVKLTLVHRLDKETSGAIIVAKSSEYAKAFSDEFKRRKVKKVYHALSYGNSKQDQFKVENYLSPISKQFGTVKPCGKHFGRDAFTEFKILNKYKIPFSVSLVECYPLTGRSHQIRSHLKTSNLAIIGDKKYNSSFKPNSEDTALMEFLFKPHYLHAKKLSIFHPFLKKNIEVNADYFNDFKGFLKKLNSNN